MTTPVTPSCYLANVRRPHWFRENVHTHDTTLADLEALLPRFERYDLGRNRFRDVIVRDGPDGPLPVGMVSKRYALMQHGDLVDAVRGGLEEHGIDPLAIPTHLLISEYGTRVAIRATLPQHYNFTPPDGHPMALTFECFNSVDGSVPMMAVVGWFRFVCANGMVVGTPTARVRQRHLPSLKIANVAEVLADGIAAAVQDRRAFDRWQGLRIGREHLAAWVDGVVADTWGPSTASRVFGIATTGQDGTPRRVPSAAPHARPLAAMTPVPGTKAPCQDGYAVAQVLAWVASQRQNVAERLTWRAQIPALMAALCP